MTILNWNNLTNMENSLVDFLQSAITSASLQLLDDKGVAKSINVYVGRELNANWALPLVQIYFDSKPDHGRLELGSNLRLTSYLMIIDVRTILPGQESNLGEWIEEIINDGFDFYNYEVDSTKPDNPIKYLLGHVHVDFISSTVVPMYDDMDVFDKNHYRLAFKAWLNQNV